MDNSTITTENTNPKQNNIDGFSVPVTTSATAAPASNNSAPIVSDIKSTPDVPNTMSTEPNTPDEMPNNDASTSEPNESKENESVKDPNLDFDKVVDSEPAPKEFKPKLSAPIRAQNYSNKGSKFLTVLLVVILIAVIVGGVYGTYTWQHNSVTTLTNQNAALSHQLSTIESELAAAKKLEATNQSNITIDLSAIGISLSVPNTLNDLTTATVTNPTKLVVNGVSVLPTEVNLGATSLAALDSSCSTANAPLGVISKTSGTYPTSPTSTNSSGKLIEQFSGYYIAYTAPLACSKTASVNTQQSSLVSDLEAALIKANITVL